MNVLKKDFSKSEKTLLLILLLVIIGAAYYLFVFIPLDEGIASARSEQEALEAELLATQLRVSRIKAMEKELSEGKKIFGGYMPSYNASKDEIDFLHRILIDTTDYSVNFTGITREGDLIRREFEMKFEETDYSLAEDVIKAIEASEIRCLIGDVVISPVERDSNLQDGAVSVNLTGTFYETLFDGTPDKDLPEDENEN